MLSWCVGRARKRSGSPRSPSTFRSLREPAALSIRELEQAKGDAAVLPPELSFLLSQGFDPAPLAKAARIARASGTDAATALLNSGLMDEETYHRALARALDLPFLGSDLALGAGTRYPESLTAGAAPLAPGGPAGFVLAPRGEAVAELLAAARAPRRRPAITSPRRLRRAVFAARPEAIAAGAADGLQARRPEWAFRPGPKAPQVALAGLALGLVVAGAAWLPASALVVLWTVVQAGFLSLVTFRLAAIFVGHTARPPDGADTPLRDEDLPVYTVLVALYREARVVPRLVLALARLDYPAAKLDLKFVIEADDPETAAALAAVPFPARFEVIVAPAGAPRTKPRALNVALPLARGACLVVYDAEDVPDPGQLREAAGIFARSSGKTACLQGRLVVDNARDSWITRCFALEYTALFDVLGPALAAWRLPIPLGGSSTHFRTAAIRSLCGYDAWNLTEDADLGIRLARAGYRVGDLPSSTIEEAPAYPRAWLRQRTRWMKGFLQTTFTHGRRPIETVRQLGPLGSLCAIAMLPGTVLSALAYPFLMVSTLHALLSQGIAETPDVWSNLSTGMAITVFLAGVAAMLLPATLGCVRRGWWDLLPFVPLLPVYFLLVSLAAWLGLIELIRAPARWNKTEHGLSRTSRSGALRPAAQISLASSAALCAGGRIRFSALMKRLRASMM